MPSVMFQTSLARNPERKMFQPRGLVTRQVPDPATQDSLGGPEFSSAVWIRDEYELPPLPWLPSRIMDVVKNACYTAMAEEPLCDLDCSLFVAGQRVNALFVLESDSILSHRRIKDLTQLRKRNSARSTSFLHTCGTGLRGHKSTTPLCARP